MANVSRRYNAEKNIKIFWIIGLYTSLTLTTWVLELLNVEAPHIRIAWSQFIKHLFSCITLVMYECIKLAASRLYQQTNQVKLLWNDVAMHFWSQVQLQWRRNCFSL